MFVNTNSFMGAATGEKASEGVDTQDCSGHSSEKEDEELAENMQRAVVGAWLLVKEATALLALLATTAAESSVDKKEWVRVHTLETIFH